MRSLLPKPALTNHPVDIGHRAEAAVLSELVRRGYRVLIPFGVNQRYDLVIDGDGKFLRAQCKTGRLRDGVIEASAQSIQSNTRRTLTRTYTGEVDLFVVYCPENHKVYVVPAEEISAGYISLRVAAPRNGQRKRVRWARDYELPA